jgi:hypothetical protein
MTIIPSTHKHTLRSVVLTHPFEVQRDGQVHGIHPVGRGRVLAPQVAQPRAELQALQQHGEVQQRLLAVLGVVGGAPAVEVALQVWQGVHWGGGGGAGEGGRVGDERGWERRRGEREVRWKV